MSPLISVSTPSYFKTAVAIAIAVSLFSPILLALGAKTQLSGARLSVCESDQKACFEIRAHKMSQSRFKPLMAFYDAELFIRSKSKSEKFKNVNGYVDFSYNILVIRTDKFEKSISLN